MSSNGSDDRPDLTAVVSDLLAAPSEGALPVLLGALDDPERTRRLRAAFGICLVADAVPETVEPLTWRLVDRLADDAENLETRHALAYLGQRYPDRVREVLLAIAEAADERDERGRHVEISRSFARNDYYGRSGPDRGVGRTRLPGGDGDDRRVYTEEGEAIGGAPAEARDKTTEALLEDVTGDESEDGDPEQSAAARRRDRAAALERAADRVGLDEIASMSQFDGLHLVEPPREGPYTTVYRTRAVTDSGEAGIAIRTFAVPDDRATAFVDAVTDALADWASVDDHDLVATLYGYDTRPRLWMATPYADRTLSAPVDRSQADALWTGLKLAEAVAHVHSGGVVHSGIDPDAVVFTGTTMEDRPMPLLSNVALLDAVRSYVEPSTCIDPRYAAPEYYDRKYGTVDHATDVYHLGAVLYSLVTGRAPYRGEYGTVREAVLTGAPPSPTDADPDLPAWVDDVVAKAMAKQKLTRYESATALVGDLKRRLGEDRSP